MNTYFETVLRRARDLWANRYEPQGARRFAVLYWRSLLVVVFVMLVAVILYGERSLYGILKDLATFSPSELPPPALDRDALDATLGAYEIRAHTYEALTSGAYIAPADPSR